MIRKKTLHIEEAEASSAQGMGTISHNHAKFEIYLIPP